MSEATIEESTAEDPSTEVTSEAESPATSTDTFWSAGSGVSELSDPVPYGHENALQKLGRPPFEKSSRSKFRLLGFLATVYEHVSDDVADQSTTEESSSEEGFIESDSDDR